VTQAQKAEVRIRPVRLDEGERLREIAVASKAHWGYDLEFVRSWAARGDYSPDGLRDKEVYVAEAHGRAIAWAAFIPRGEVMWLDDLWVEPEWIGKGVGSLLFHRIVERARARGGTRLEWQAELNSIGFYEKVGGRYLRDGEPTSWGRILPIMGFDLE
jgi:GNAT superfamily N-acetyltransferase